jgi:uncharacterized RDD family membrane protein YckC
VVFTLEGPPMSSSIPGGPDDPWAVPSGDPPYGQQPYGQPYGQQPYGQQPYYGGGFPPPPPPGSTYPGYGYSTAPGGAALASTGRRFGGLVIDALLVAIPAVLIGMGTGAYRTTRTCDVNGDCGTGYHFSTNWAVDLAALVIGMAYSAYFVGMRCQSIGHRVTGIKVVDVDTGGPIGAGRGAVRWLVMGVTGALCTLGYWSPFFDSQRRQGWHDKATKAIALTAPRS